MSEFKPQKYEIFIHFNGQIVMKNFLRQIYMKMYFVRYRLLCPIQALKYEKGGCSAVKIN